LRELVVSCCDPLEILELAEAALDDVAFFIVLFGMPDALMRLDLPGMTGLIPSFPRKARNASVSWPPERSASNALDARRVAEGVGQKFLDAGDRADAFLRHERVGGIAGRADKVSRLSLTSHVTVGRNELESTTRPNGSRGGGQDIA
jgi:hypothetical protein